MENLTFFEIAKILISFAVCAPSGHNSQPWKFQIVGNTIVISPDFTKRLAVVDSSDKELFISLGCALENMQIAATNYGYLSEYDYTDGKIIVTFTKSDNCAVDTLFSHIKERHTYRGSFTGEKIPQERIDALKSIDNENGECVRIFEAGTPQADFICRQISEGNTIQMSDTAFKRELLSWMRFNKKHIAQTHNGLCYNVLGFPATPQPMGRTIVKMALNPKSQNKTDDKVNASASHFCILCSNGTSKKDYIALGKTLERVLLTVCGSGLSYNFSNQACEIPELTERLRSELGISNYPAVTLRLGYGGEPKSRAPRESVENVMVE